MKSFYKFIQYDEYLARENFGGFQEMIFLYEFVQ
jgi:hypothetical protein